MHEVQIPGARLARVNQSLKRRLDDDVEEVFNRACATNDLEAAADLLALLEKWHARRPPIMAGNGGSPASACSARARNWSG